MLRSRCTHWRKPHRDVWSVVHSQGCYRQLRQSLCLENILRLFVEVIILNFCVSFVANQLACSRITLVTLLINCRSFFLPSDHWVCSGPLSLLATVSWRFTFYFTGVCQLPSSVGPCKGNFTRFFYDTNMKKCRPFSFGGCRGNQNKFDSMGECEASCASVMMNTGECRELVCTCMYLCVPEVKLQC